MNLNNELLDDKDLILTINDLLLFRTYNLEKDLVLRGALPIAFVAEAPTKGVPFSGFWYRSLFSVTWSAALQTAWNKRKL